MNVTLTYVTTQDETELFKLVTEALRLDHSAIFGLVQVSVEERKQHIAMRAGM